MMFKDDLAKDWLPSSDLCCSTAPRPVSFQVTRRQLLGAPVWLGVGCSSSAAFASTHRTVEEVGQFLVVRHAAREWWLAKSAFGKRATFEIAPDQQSFTIRGAHWPGTGTNYEFNARFPKLSSIAIIEAKALGLFATPISFADFLDGKAYAQSPITQDQAATLIRSTGWSAGAGGGKNLLTFHPDGSFEIAGARITSNGLVAAHGLTIRAHPPGQNPLDRFLARKAGWSIGASANGIELARRPTLRCGKSNGGDVLDLKPRNIGQAARARWENGQSALGLQGIWQVDIKGGGAKSAFRSANGLVLLGEGGKHAIAATLPLGNTPQLLALPTGSAWIGGGDDRHRAELRSAGGRLERCEVRSLLRYFPIPIEGADYSQLQFDDQDFVLTIGEPPPADVISFLFSAGLSGGRWWIPLDRAHLRVARARDLLSLHYRFQGVALVRRLTDWQLELLDRKSDPLMAVDFPPQHVLEEAFFAQMIKDDSPPFKPKVPLDEETLANRDKPYPTFLPPAEIEAERTKRDRDYTGTNDEPRRRVVEARLSGTSRLVFRLTRHRWRRSVPLDLSLDGLTDWEALEVVVTKSAATVMNPETGQPVTDPFKILVEKDVPPFAPGTNGLTAYKQRIAAVLNLAIKGEPGLFATAIEVPARMSLSTDQNAVFAAGRPDFSQSRLKHSGRAVGLWSVRLAAGPSKPIAWKKGTKVNKAFARSEVRAVASPDFRPEFFRDGKDFPQDHQAPWDETRKLRLPMSSKDRHELIALSVLYGLPVLPRLTRRAPNAPVKQTPVPDNVVVSPAKGSSTEAWAIPGFKEQGVYLPPAMPVQELRLTSLGGSLSVTARFEPPAAPYWEKAPQPGMELSPFPALTVEAWNQRTILMRDQSVELVYKGFLFPLGHRASLLKRTERYYLGHPGKLDPPVAFLIQRYFIRINKLEKSFPALGHPFHGRDFPISHIRFRRSETPDILDPTEGSAVDPLLDIAASGKVTLPGAKGAVFWPRTQPRLGGEVQFDLSREERDGAVTLPLLFLDNSAAHDPCTVSAVHDFYMNLPPDSGLTTAAFSGARQRYAPELDQGNNSFDTARWILGSRGRGDRPGAPFQMDAAMEGVDQPPFYPFTREGHVTLHTLQRFTGKTDDRAIVFFDELYVRNGFAPSANPAEIFLAVHGTVPGDPAGWFGKPNAVPGSGRTRNHEPVRMSLNGTGDRSGGIAQPDTVLVGLSRVSGPVGGQQPPAAPIYAKQITDCTGVTKRGLLPIARSSPPPLFDDRSPGAEAKGARGGMFCGTDFFPADAKLLGLLPLRDLVKTVLYDKAPKLIEEAQAAAEEVSAQLAKVRAELRPLIVAAGAGLSEAKRLLKETETPYPLGTNGAMASVAQLYPRLASALDATLRAQQALAAEFEAGGDEFERIAKILKGVKAFNQALAGTLVELDRIGRDPIPAELATLIGKVVAGSKTLLEAIPGLLFALVRDEAERTMTALLAGKPKRWIAATFGPDAYPLVEDLLRPQSKAEFEAALQALASTASEALCYEWAGRPVLEAIGAAQRLDADLVAAGAEDFRVLTVRTIATCERLATAAIASAQSAIGLEQGCQNASALLNASAGVIAKLSSATDGLMAPLADIDKHLDGTETALATLAGIETTLADCLKTAGAHLEHSRASLARGLTAGGKSAFAADDQAHAAVVAAMTAVRDLRARLATSAQRLRETLESLKAVQKDLEPKIDACSAEVDLSSYLGAASRWLAQRSRMLGEVVTMVRAAADAVGAALPSAPTTAGVTSDCALDSAKLLNDAAGEAAKILASATAVMRDLTTLRLDKTGLAKLTKSVNDTALLMNEVARLDILGDTGLGRLGAIGEWVKAHETLATSVQVLPGKFQSILKPDVEQKAAELRTLLQETASLILAADDYAREAERRLIGAVTAPLAAIEAQTAQALGRAASPIVKVIATSLAKLHETVLTVWQPFEYLIEGSGSAEVLKFILRPDLYDTLFDGSIGAEIRADQAALERLSQLPAEPRPEDYKALALWRDRIRAAQGKATGVEPPALYRLAEDLGETIDSLLHGRIQDLIDVPAIRRRIAGALISLTLPRINVSYGLKTDVNALPPFFKMAEKRSEFGGDPKDKAKDLELRFEMNVDLANPGRAAMNAKGILQPFEVNIFQVVTLYFRKATFTATDGGNPDIDIKVADVKLGAAVEFIQQLQETLGIGSGSGFFLDIKLSPPAIEAGFAIDLGTVSIGTVSFINVSLGASVELPFTNSPALFRFNLARRAAPFLISAAPFGGGGFLSIISSAKGLEGFEASFEYGGVIGFGFGPLKGSGRVTTGLYIAQSRTSARLSGFFVAAGSAHIACFSVSACLLISIEQANGGNVEGSATFTFSFSIGIKDFEYKVGVQRTIAKGWSGGAGRGLTQISPDRFAGFLAGPTSSLLLEAAADPCNSDAPISAAMAMNADWKRYRSYFDEDL